MPHRDHPGAASRPVGPTEPAPTTRRASRFDDGVVPCPVEPQWLARANVSGYFIVDIRPDDAGFKLNCYREGGARIVTGYSAVGEVLTPENRVVPTGAYAVGTDIKPGRYQLSGSCYWARLSGFSGELADIIANDNTDGPFIVSILATDIGFEITCR